MTERSIPITLSLQYDHSIGDFADYFDSLALGRARASQCSKCGDVRIPPRFTCPYDGAATEAIDLTGAGRVVAITRGDAALPLTDATSVRCFVLVAMEGANNFMFGRMVDANADISVETYVQLVGDGAESPHPAGAAIFKRAKDQ